MASKLSYCLQMIHFPSRASHTCSQFDFTSKLVNGNHAMLKMFVWWIFGTCTYRLHGNRDQYCGLFGCKTLVWKLNFKRREVGQGRPCCINSQNHTCPIHSKCVESSVCIDKSSWQKSCREIHEVILTGSWQTLQEVWLQSPEMVILREWGVEMSSSRDNSTRVDTTRYF